MKVGNCKACNELKETSLETARKGIGEEQCKSLQNDTGLNPKLPVLHNDCEDLNDLNDCFIDSFSEEIETYDDCDWKEYAKDHNSHIWNVFKAIICAICGLWKNIHDLWADLSNIWKNINDLWLAIKNINDKISNILIDIKNLWDDSKSVWQNINEIWKAINSLKDKDSSLQTQINDINKKMPGGFSTLVSKVLWQGNAHAGQTFKLSEPLSNFDLVRVKYNVGGSQYSTDLLPGYFNPNLANVATYSGIDYAGDYEFRACGGLEGTSTALSSLVMTASKSTLVYYNLSTGKIDQWFKGTATSNKTGECIISRIEGLREISYK